LKGWSGARGIFTAGWKRDSGRGTITTWRERRRRRRRRDGSGRYMESIMGYYYYYYLCDRCGGLKADLLDTLKVLEVPLHHHHHHHLVNDMTSFQSLIFKTFTITTTITTTTATTTTTSTTTTTMS